MLFAVLIVNCGLNYSDVIHLFNKFQIIYADLCFCYIIPQDPILCITPQGFMACVIIELFFKLFLLVVVLTSCSINNYIQIVTE